MADNLLEKQQNKNELFTKDGTLILMSSTCTHSLQIIVELSIGTLTLKT